MVEPHAHVMNLDVKELAIRMMVAAFGIPREAIEASLESGMSEPAEAFGAAAEVACKYFVEQMQAGGVEPQVTTHYQDGMTRQ
jgi:hypothetical protein